MSPQEILESESGKVDAVMTSTPDRWHALQTTHACEAGKDVGARGNGRRVRRFDGHRLHGARIDLNPVSLQLPTPVAGLRSLTVMEPNYCCSPESGMPWLSVSRYWPTPKARQLFAHASLAGRLFSGSQHARPAEGWALGKASLLAVRKP